jgi:CHAD domain-containing protein
MLSKKKQRHYLHKESREWLRNLQAFDATHDEAALHQLRVALKKLKAFAHFSTACSGAPAVKDFGGLQKLFKQAGMARDAGNQLKLLHHFPAAPESFKKEQHHIRTVAEARLTDGMKQFRRQGKKAGRRLLADIRPISFACIRDWYAVQMIKTGVLLTAGDDQLHKARKGIKQLLYVHSLLPRDMADRLRLNRDYLDRLQEAIGEWHDAALMVAAWAATDIRSSEAMIKECSAKEAAVRQLAGDFYLQGHIS